MYKLRKLPKFVVFRNIQHPAMAQARIHEHPMNFKWQKANDASHTINAEYQYVNSPNGIFACVCPSDRWTLDFGMILSECVGGEDAWPVATRCYKLMPWFMEFYKYENNSCICVVCVLREKSILPAMLMLACCSTMPAAIEQWCTGLHFVKCIMETATTVPIFRIRAIFHWIGSSNDSEKITDIQTCVWPLSS